MHRTSLKAFPVTILNEADFRCIFRDIRPAYSDNIRPFVPAGIRPGLTRCREALVVEISFLAFRRVVEGLSFGRIVRRVRAGRRCASRRSKNV